MTRTLAQLPTVVQTLTGLDVADAVRRFTHQSAPALPAVAAASSSASAGHA